MKNEEFSFSKLKIHASHLRDKELMHYASSLSFHTVLSLLPVLLVSLSIFTQLPSFHVYYEKIKGFIFSNLLPSHQDTISNYLEQFLSNSVSVGLISFVAIIFTSIMFFMDYGYVISKITKTPSKGFWRSLSSYWTLITLAPLGMSVSFYLSGKAQELLNKTELTSSINILAFLPFIIVWGIFGVTYIISINKEISYKNIILSSLITSIIWNISKLIFIKYVFYNKTYLSIYGSFSVLLFFFIWIYISWIIFLYGVKICAFLDEQERHNSQKSEHNSQDFESNSKK